MPAIPSHSMAMTDSEAGPDIADDEFKPANADIFKARTKISQGQARAL